MKIGLWAFNELTNDKLAFSKLLAADDLQGEVCLWSSTGRLW